MLLVGHILVQLLAIGGAYPAGGAPMPQISNITSNATATLSDCQQTPSSTHLQYLALLSLLSLLGIPVYLRSKKPCVLPTLSAQVT